MFPVKTSFLRLGQRVPGVLYEPVGLEKEKLTAVLVMHSDEDYLSCPTGPYLAERGYRVLQANPPIKEGLFFNQDRKMHAVLAAMEYLKAREDVGKIVLMGHSGGATLMTAYQAVAENGPGVFQGEEMIYPYEDSTELIPADAVMLFDANWGNSVMQLFSLDPAVTDETSGRKLDESLNLFNPENGFDPAGSRFSDDFIRAFQRSQSARNMRILAAAKERLRLIRAGQGNYIDDEPLVIPGANQVFFNNKLYAQDIRLMAHTDQPHPLVHPDGSVTVEIVRSLRAPENPVSLTDNMMDGARIMTVKNYLSSYAVETEEDFGYDESRVWGIRWESTCSSPVGNVRHIRVPLLVIGMTAGWEYLASETIFNEAASERKAIAFIEGADHKFRPARHLEKTPGEFGDTVKTLHDYAAAWLATI